MRAVYYLICWLLTLIVGAVIATFIFQEVQIGLLCTLIAGALSAPFILIYCIVMHHHLKKNPTATQVHLTTFGYHFIGSVLTLGAMLVYAGRIEFELVGIVSGYFLIDSVFFHATIARLHEKVEIKVSEPEILDQEP